MLWPRTGQSPGTGTVPACALLGRACCWVLVRGPQAMATCPHMSPGHTHSWTFFQGVMIMGEQAGEPFISGRGRWGLQVTLPSPQGISVWWDK